MLRYALVAMMAGVIILPAVMVAVALGLFLSWPAWLIVMLGLAVYAPAFAWVAWVDRDRARGGYHWAA